MLAKLLSVLFPVRADEALVRDASPDDLLAQLDAEVVGAQGLSCTALLPFPHPLVRASIHEAKYHGTEKAFTLLAQVLAEYLRELATEYCEFKVGHPMSDFVLVPVPLGTKRRKERGYNQVEEVLICAIKMLNADGVPSALHPELLVRTRDTVSQVSLPRDERLTNMRGAFLASPELLRTQAGRHGTYIVCDDVLTTGATLTAACAALKEAGAENVLAIAWAH